MTSIILTVALVIAIICDIIRIYQYVQMKRQNRTDVVNKIDRLSSDKAKQIKERCDRPMPDATKDCASYEYDNGNQ